MKYFSTRNNKLSESFKSVLFQGLSKDGGLFLPITMPKIDIKTIKSDLTTAEVNLRLNQNKIDDIEQRIGGLEKRLYNGELRNNREIELTQN